MHDLVERMLVTVLAGMLMALTMAMLGAWVMAGNVFAIPQDTLRIVFSLFLIGVGIAICQQITGVNSIMYYGTEILKQSGFGTQAALTANIANGVISVLATFVGIWLLGRVGRRPMLMVGQIGTIVALALIGVFSMMLPEGTARGFVILGLTVTFLAFQQGAISPVTWLMLSEIFPLKIRGLGMGSTAFILWMVNFAVGFSFPILVERLGISYVMLGRGFVRSDWRRAPGLTGLELAQRVQRHEIGC